MIQSQDTPEVIHSNEPVRRIDMSVMDDESIKFMLIQSRDGFYSNKILAPIREYSTNARDAHIEAKIPNIPIEVTLPSQFSPELKIRDYGRGLSLNELTDTYFRYWKSTKRNNNEANGFLGLGSKAAMAYCDIYTVISICNGMKIICTGQRNGFCDVIYHQPKSSDEKDGIEIIIPVLQKDIDNFVNEALDFFKYWDIRPIIKGVEEDKLKKAYTTMDSTPFLSGDGWAVRPAGCDGKGDSRAIMSAVAYKIDWDQIRNNLTPEVSSKIGSIFDFLEENISTLYFKNGTLSFTPNRESLQYNEATVKAISNKLVEIYQSLLTLITNKISVAPTIWDAKIAYNQIFRKELDGFDKGVFYGGNLNIIENLLRGRVNWNGILLENGCFEEVDEWDKNQGNVSNRCDGNFSPLFSCFVKDKDKGGIKNIQSGGRRRRRYGGANISKIIASPKSVVVIQDTDKNYLAKGYARWILCQSGKDVSQVYILNLSNPTVKKDFYKYYNFDTVPVVYVSQNIDMIKSYLKTVRAPRNNGGGGNSHPMYCPFVEIKNRESKGYISTPYWDNEDVNAHQMTTGGYYVIFTKKDFTFGSHSINHDNSNNFWQAIYSLALMAGKDLPKVYGIHLKTSESVWFKESVEEGEWTPLSEWIDENINCLPKDIFKKMSAYRTFTTNRVGLVTAEDLSPLILDKNGTASNYFNKIGEFSKYWNIKDIPTTLRVNGFAHDEAESNWITSMNNGMKNKYPLLFQVGNCNRYEEYYKFSKETLDTLADYINLKDFYSQVSVNRS